MKLRMEFNFEAGEETCAKEKGKFCQFFQWTSNGKATCWLFGEKLHDKDGWVQRCQKCKDQATEVEGFCGSDEDGKWHEGKEL